MSIKLIAETAAHHEGDFSFMLNLIDSIINSRADIVKVHVTQDLDEYMASSHAVYDLLHRLRFDEAQWHEIFSRIKDKSKSLMALVNDPKAIELSAHYSPDYYEIHSVALNDINLLSALKSNISEKNKVVLGVGGSTLEEIENAISYLDFDGIVLMFGFQNYPTKYEDINFNKIRRIKSLFPEYEYGYADHTAWDEPNNSLITLLGAALGVQYVEKHVTTECGFDRIDGSSAVSFEQFDQIKSGLDVLNSCNGNGLLELNQAERDYCVFGPMKKAPVVRGDVRSGQELTCQNLAFKRTGATTDLSQIRALELIGRKFTRDMKAGSILRSSDFEGQVL